MGLVTGVACRRCGGTLQAEDAHEDRGNREAGPAVRAGLLRTGTECGAVA
jgi:hypothetical protein